MSTDLTKNEPHGPAGPRTWTVAICIGGSLLMAIALTWGLFGAHHDAHAEHAHAPTAWLLGTIPFIVILGAIALLPLIPKTAGWWHSNLSRFLVAVLCGLGTLLYIWIAEG